ncbi:MAG TPA: ATP-binding protein [bacterium]
MRVPLRRRFSLFLVLSIASITLASTLLFAAFFRAAAEKEIVARGVALCQSLARAAAAGLAAEDLDLLAKAADIVRGGDVAFVQVFSAIWSPIDAYPFEQLRQLPAAEAVEHFRGGDTEPLRLAGSERFDFYVPIRFSIPQAPETTIGYARLALSAAPLRSSLRSVVLSSVLIGLVLGLLFLVAAQVVIGRTVVGPILNLHAAAARFRSGHPPEAVPAVADDEIADLTQEFHAMSLALRERELRLSEEKERLAVTLRSIGDGVIVADVDGLVTLVNRVAEELTGWSSAEAVGRRFCEVFAIQHEQTREPCANVVARVLADGVAVSLPGRTVLVRRDGTDILIEDAAAPIRDRESEIIGVVLVFRDVTEKRRLEDELLKAEKLRALGVLAGGIAHDFNNLLTGILGNVSLARARLGPGDSARDHLERAEAAAGRAAELTGQLLTFSKGGAPVRRAADIVAILKESARFWLSGSSVRTEFSVEGATWPVEVDAGQMSQVFNNLVINAVQAMPGGGRISFVVRNAAPAAEAAGLPAGDYVVVEVRDEGGGIAEENRGRIFDPYFTTKPDGAGLGLTSAYSIVKRHGGGIEVESTPGKGTTFRVWLPASRAAGTLPAAPRGEQAPHVGHGAVLVMDDEQVVRAVAVEMLRSLGYDAAAAENGQEALALYRQALEQGRPFRAVIMDLTVPGGMGGKEAVTRLLALDPGARVIVSSGYSNDPVMAEYRAHGFRGVIVKPYGTRAFAETLREVLGGA